MPFTIRTPFTLLLRHATIRHVTLCCLRHTLLLFSARFRFFRLLIAAMPYFSPLADI